MKCLRKENVNVKTESIMDETAAKNWEYTEHTRCDAQGKMSTRFEIYSDNGSSSLIDLTIDDLRSLKNTIDGLIMVHEEVQMFVSGK